MRRTLLHVLCILPTFAHAQTYEAPKVCWLNGEEYSPGSTMRAAEGAMVCSPELVWVKSDKPAGCLKDGRLSGPGAVAKGETKDAPATRCQADGTWMPIE